MQRRVVFVIAAAVSLAACSPKSNQRTYDVHGQVVAVTPDRQEAIVKHGEIAGLMPAMTMPYKIKEKAELNAVKPGDMIDATLVIAANDAFLTGVKKVGEAPLEQAPPEPTTVTTGSGVPLLKPGDVVPDSTFVDQDGKKRTFKSFRGSTVVLTFIYTRCPLPTFCPMMDRHFVAIQERMHDDPLLKKVHLVTITLRPGLRHAGGAQEARAGARRRPESLDVPDRRARSHREIRRAVRRVRHPRVERSARHYAQPADGHRRPRRQDRQDLHGQ